MTVFYAIATIIVGALLTTKSMLAEPPGWRTPFVMMLGLCLTVLAFIGVVASEVCK